MHRRGKLVESCFDSHSPAPGTCVRLQASNSISDLYLNSRSEGKIIIAGKCFSTLFLGNSNGGVKAGRITPG
jgi:hypothetical protein